MRWLEIREEPCPYCAVWMGPHHHSVRDDDTLGVVIVAMPQEETT